MTRAGPTLAAIALLLGACVADNRPENCGEPSVTLDLVVTASSLSPRSLDVCREQQVTIVVAPQVNGVLHIHVGDDLAPAITIRSGESQDLSFAATRSGQFTIELHTDERPDGLELGLLTVHEP